ncbi:hypothetical protein [Nonomuraea sp. SYSU D8015]|uniref:hypothetical protein n=1 Tax=Nonomuraea sp. SYSU D8015 TaxID=2593644 RepID=UPI00166117C4|nr:hypothetical protein [Nonomuraea sp. SYSU D8015]
MTGPTDWATGPTGGVAELSGHWPGEPGQTTGPGTDRSVTDRSVTDRSVTDRSGERDGRWPGWSVAGMVGGRDGRWAGLVSP